MSVYTIGCLNGDVRNLLAAVDMQPLMPDDVLICLGNTMLGPTDASSALKTALDDLGCTVAILRGDDDIRFWRALCLGDYGHAPHLIPWHEDWVMVEPSYPNILYFPDAGGIFAFGNAHVLVLPSTITPASKMAKNSSSLDEALVPKLWQVVYEQVIDPPDAIVSFSCPYSGAFTAEAGLLAQVRDLPLLDGVPWYHPWRPEHAETPRQPDSITVRGNALTKMSCL